VALTWDRTHDWDGGSWRVKAACRSSDPDLFFPIGTTGGAKEQIVAAKHICQACGVAQQCLEFALLTNQESGIWGGLSEDERRKVRARQAQSAPAAPAARGASLVAS
jgi:WhiB family redox-sensing transcriptional regulator